MTDGTMDTVDGRPVLRFERALSHSVDRVWQAVSVPEELRSWFPAAVDWIPAVGELIEVGGMTGEVTEVEPPHRLAWNFAGDHYAFDLAESKAGCLLVFTHVFSDRTAAGQVAAGWHCYFTRLEPHLDGGYLSEQESHARWAEHHDRYAERFGIDPEPGRLLVERLRAGR